MSAVNIVLLPRHKQAIVAADAAAYSREGIVQVFLPKIHVAQNWPGIITGTGTVLAAEILAPAVFAMFDTFDDAVSGIESALPAIVGEHELAEAHYDLTMVGWSHARNAPESYVIPTTTTAPLGMSADEEKAARNTGSLDAFKLRKLDRKSFTPIPGFDLVLAASYESFDEADTPEQATRVIRLMMEMQRHQKAKGLHWVGGWIDKAVITAAGVETETLDIWEDDAVGELIIPVPIDWAAFRTSIGLSPGMAAAEQETVKQKLADLERQLAEVNARNARRLSAVPLTGSRAERRAMKAKLRKAS